jgi:two-component system response regulator BaeR
MSHVLIVEDEPKLAQLVIQYLEREGYAWNHIADGGEVLPWLNSHSTDLVLLDLNLPGKDGLSICRELRAQSQVPIIMTTARVDELDRLLGLELGADDYLCKPYSPRELVARVKAVLRRVQLAVDTSQNEKLILDESRLTVSFKGQNQVLTSVEFALLKRLAEQPGRIYSRDHLMDTIYPDHRVVNDRTIDSHIKKLRRKLELLDPQTEWIESVYGAGYRLRP